MYQIVAFHVEWYISWSGEMLRHSLATKNTQINSSLPNYELLQTEKQTNANIISFPTPFFTFDDWRHKWWHIIELSRRKVMSNSLDIDVIYDNIHGRHAATWQLASRGNFSWHVLTLIPELISKSHER